MSPPIREVIKRQSVEPLQLRYAELSYALEAMYVSALRDHAISIVERWLEVENGGAQEGDVLAEFQSDRGGNQFEFSSYYDRSLRAAILDLGVAIGHPIPIADWDESGGQQCSQLFLDALPGLDLPDTLKALLKETEQKNEVKKRKGRLFVLALGILETMKIKMGITPIPEFMLKISFTTDPTSLGLDHLRDTYSYHRLIHRVTVQKITTHS